MFKFKKQSYIHKDVPSQDVWYHYFNEIGESKDCYHQTNCQILHRDLKIYVFDCSFISLKKGVFEIIFNRGPKFLHSFCFFDSCSNDSVGGAINFRCSSPIIQDRFCAINSSIRDYAYPIHSYTGVYKDKNDSYRNFIVESCITLCGGKKQRDLIDMNFGICGIFSSNISKNNAETETGFCILRH